MKIHDFEYVGERFADIQVLRYRLNGFEALTTNQKLYIYYLSQAALCGRDITTDQFGKYNLRIRKMLESVYQHYQGNRETAAFGAFLEYLKRVWFSNGIYHHYGCEKFVPQFGEDDLREWVGAMDATLLPLSDGETTESLLAELVPVIFNPNIF